jgi:hypothetical protein
MKKALVGVSDNISQHFHKIVVWAKSFHKHSTDSIVLLCINSSPEEIIKCEQLGIKPILVNLPPQTTNTIYHKRLKFVLDFLLSTDIEVFLITDVFDVVFQGDPFAKLDLENYDVFVGEEGVTVNEEPWNHHTLGSLFPNHVKACEHIGVVCSGVIAGKKLPLIDLYHRMYDLCENYSTDDHNIKDQAALIVMLAHNEIPKIKVFNINDAWAVHCAVAGPTQFFHSWGFNEKLKSKNLNIPVLDNDGIVKTLNGAYDIVHQFNRIPEWNDILTKPYLN